MNSTAVNTTRSNTTPRRSGFKAAFAALGAAAQWRLLLLWLLATLVPTLLIALPLGTSLQAQFGHSLYAADIAAGRDLPLLIQGFIKMAEQLGWLPVNFALAALAMLLLSPWLGGMVVASLRAGRRLGFGDLVRGGVTEYGRLLRMLLWSVIPLGIAIAIGAGVMGAMHKSTEQAILASEVQDAARIGWIVAVVVFVLAHATVEAGRGWFGADAGLRSAIKAWWRGLKLLLRRPLATLGAYVCTTVVGAVLALAFAWLRVRADGAGGSEVALAFVLGQGIALALAWGRIARLYALADLAANTAVRQASVTASARSEVDAMAAPTAPQPA